MTKPLVLFLTSCCLLLCTKAEGAAYRYALIIGNNSGSRGIGTETIPPLKYAEKDAAALKLALIERAHFDASDTRTQLLIATTRDDIARATERLRSQKSMDESFYSGMETLFLLYFIGPADGDALLLEDGPLPPDELVTILHEMDADTTVAVLDARTGAERNTRRTTDRKSSASGFTLFNGIPEALRETRGMRLYASCSPGQLGREDDAFGGIFTHFFIEAIRSAAMDEIGMSIERIWQYTRKQTMAYTAEQGRHQIPVRFITAEKSKPLYFSFPSKKSAILTLSSSVKGHFALSHADGHLVDFFVKQDNRPASFSVYPGHTTLTLLSNDATHPVKSFTLKPFEEMVIHTSPQEAPRPEIGNKIKPLWVRVKDRATVLTTGATLLGGVSYSFNASSKQKLFPEHEGAVAMRFDFANLSLGLRGGYGYEREVFSAWSYSAHSFSGDVSMGAGFNTKRTRVALRAALGGARIWQRYDNDDRRFGFAVRSSLLASWTFPSNGNLLGELFCFVGPTYSTGVSVRDAGGWYVSGGMGIAAYYRLL